VFVVVGRQALIDSEFSTVICAPIYTQRSGLASQVDVGPEHGLKHDSAVLCDALVSIPKATLTNFVASLQANKVVELDDALRVALSLG